MVWLVSNLYNRDEVGLHFKLLLAKSLACKEKNSVSLVLWVARRLTILAYSNATGDQN